MRSLTECERSSGTDRRASSSVITAVTPCAACSGASMPRSASTSDVKQRTTCARQHAVSVANVTPHRCSAPRRVPTISQAP